MDIMAPHNSLVEKQAATFHSLLPVQDNSQRLDHASRAEKRRLSPKIFTYNALPIYLCFI